MARYQLAARMMGASTETTIVAPTRGQAAERDRSEQEADREYSNCLRDFGLGAQRKQIAHTFRPHIPVKASYAERRMSGL
jgi:hypothetical protein